MVDGSEMPKTGMAAGRRPGRRLDVGVWFLGILAMLAIVWTLRLASWITMPIMAALFIALAVWPVCAWVQARVPRQLKALGYAAAMLVVLALLAAFFGSLWFAAMQVADEAPRHADKLMAHWHQASAWIDETAASVTGKPAGETGQDAPGASAGGSDPVTSAALAAANALWQSGSLLILILFLVLLMLVEAPVWSAKLANTAGDEARQTWHETLAVVAQRFRQFLVVSSLLGVLTGVLYVGWLSLWGIDFVLLWGLLAFLLNYIPMAGSLIAGALPVLMALVQKDLATAASVAAGLMVIEQVMGNYVAPRVQGKQLSISPLVIMAALLLWGWVWGWVGTVLATPITVLMAIVLDQIPALKPAALFLSDQRDLDSFEEQLRS